MPRPAEDTSRPDLLPVNPDLPDPDVIAQAARVITDGGLLVYPTEHFYALGCDYRSEDSVARLFAAKGRATDVAIPLAIADRGQLEELVAQVPKAARPLVDAWPEGLTLVFPAGRVLPALTGGHGTIGVRLVRCPVARALIEELGMPLPATSANRSGKGASAFADRVAAELPGLAMVLDAGELPGGRASTVLDVTRSPWRVLREGAVGITALTLFGEVAGPEA